MEFSVLLKDSTKMNMSAHSDFFVLNFMHSSCILAQIRTMCSGYVYHHINDVVCCPWHVWHLNQAWQNLQDLCDQPSLRSACISSQYDKGFCLSFFG